VTTRTTTTTITGKVEVYEAGKTLTLTQADGSKVTYVINEKSKVPADLVIGKTVSILPLATAARARPSRRPSPTSRRPRRDRALTVKAVQNPGSPGSSARGGPAPIDSSGVWPATDGRETEDHRWTLAPIFGQDTLTFGLLSGPGMGSKRSRKSMRLPGSTSAHGRRHVGL